MIKNYLLLVALLISTVTFGQVLVEDFDYGTTAGDLTAVSGGAWVQHSGSTGPVAYVAAPASLTMAGYPSSGIGGHATYSGTSQDVNRAFTGISSGTVYGSALINLSAVGTGNYFMHFNSGGFRARVGAQDDGSGNVLFGIGASSSTLTYGTTPYSLNTTYLLVFSYEIATGVSNLYVLSAVTPTEPATPEATNTGSTGTTISAIAFRQSSNIPAVAIDGVRIATNWNEIMNNSSVPSLSIVTPADASVFDPGTSNVDVTFTTQNIDLMIAGNQVNVTVDANPTDADTTSPYSVTTMDGGMYNVTVELLENNMVVDTKMVSFSVAAITQVTNITDLRAGTIGEYYELTGQAFISYIVTEGTRNQKYIQDGAAGILIDDVAGTLSAPLNIGDGIIGLQGQLSQFGGVLQFVPTANIPGAATTGNTITPIDVTVSDLLTNGETYESRLIRLIDATFDAGDVGGMFADNTNYNVTVVGGTDMTVCRVSFGDEDIIGSVIPSTHVNIIGLGGEFNGTRQVLPRYASDIEDALSTEEFGTTSFSMYPNPSNGSTVTISSASNNAKDVKVYSIIGRQVINTTITNTLDVSGLQSGVYVVQITENGKSATKKLVIK
ncbi:T9SS type A sorting domain-containing protein [Kordia sp. YSTF-M3]|uniref:T9SS type A sorting domain-containing protein n=1 Tax=Kordia aestuariivivens TaxID=2759037 RepID=A0ABR7QAB8_9FLAO|nr:T9SS type A sorting domain-containing protein [Kordia aestuariivivens]MBC8755519.1 T9SS type A sorting domain-containing protein [Kordia aestuariivivens]